MSGPPQYLLVLHLAERERGPPVRPGSVAAVLDRSPAATTEMLQRLEGQGLVTLEPYEGATLTAEGRARAAELRDSYVTLARFFREVLDLADAEQEALLLAGTVSATVTERLTETVLEDEDPSEPERSLLARATDGADTH